MTHTTALARQQRYLRASQCEILDLISTHPRSARTLSNILFRTEDDMRHSLRVLQDKGLAWPSGNLVRENHRGPLAYMWSGTPPLRTYTRLHMITQPRLVSISRDLLLWLRDRQVFLTACQEHGLAGGDAPSLFIAPMDRALSLDLVQIPATPEGYTTAIRERTEWVVLPDNVSLDVGDRVTLRETRDSPVQEISVGDDMLGKMLVGVNSRTAAEKLVQTTKGGELLSYRASHTFRRGEHS